MFLSYQYDIASGAAIVLLSAAVFAAVYAATTLKRAIAVRRQVVPAPEPRTPRAPRPELARATIGHDDHLFD
jgi:hypothetical protein